MDDFAAGKVKGARKLEEQAGGFDAKKPILDKLNDQADEIIAIACSKERIKELRELLR